MDSTITSLFSESRSCTPESLGVVSSMVLLFKLELILSMPKLLLALGNRGDSMVVSIFALVKSYLRSDFRLLTYGKL